MTVNPFWFGVSFFGGYMIGFSSGEDSVFKNQVQDAYRAEHLKAELETLRTRCHPGAEKHFDAKMYGLLHIVTADQLKK